MSESLLTDPNRTLVVVEPHADDAFLSMGQHIEDRTRAGLRSRVWTIFSGTRKRGAEAQTYAEAVGAEAWLGFGFVEGQPLDRERFRSLFNDNDSEEFVYAVPIGIVHPEHIAVREEMLDCSSRSVYFYMDQPYAITQKNGPLINQFLFGRTVISYRKPSVRKYRHIPIFKDQSKFYHYNPPEKLIQTFELVVA